MEKQVMSKAFFAGNLPQVTLRWGGAVAAVLAALALTGPSPVAAHPPFGISYSHSHYQSRGFLGGGYTSGGFGHTSFYGPGAYYPNQFGPPQYGVGHFGVTVGLPGYGAIGGGYVQPITQYPPYGVTSIGGLNIGYGAVGGYLPYGVYGPGPWSHPAVGYYQPVGPAPGYIPADPNWNAASPFNNPAIQEWLPENQRVPDAQPRQAAIPQGVQPRVIEPLPRVSNLEAKRRSIKFEALGDEAFNRRDWADAYARYKQAVEQAPDRLPARSKLGYTMTLQGAFSLAATEFKRIATQDRDWPVTGVSLEQAYGPNSELMRASVMQRVSAWVREDIRDPDRLFLMGVMLHFNKETDKGAEFLRMAAQITQGAPHVMAFFDQGDNGRPARGAVVPVGAEVPAPVEEGVEAPAPGPRLIVPGAAAPAAPRNAEPAPGQPARGQPTPILPRNSGNGPKLFAPQPAGAPAPVSTGAGPGPRVIEFPKPAAKAPTPAAGPTLAPVPPAAPTPAPVPVPAEEGPALPVPVLPPAE
jgi:hypothetical protein